MSIVRWIEQADGKMSDVYIFYTDKGIACMSRLDNDLDFEVPTAREAIEHLLDMEDRGHHVPSFVYEALKEPSEQA